MRAPVMPTILDSSLLLDVYSTTNPDHVSPDQGVGWWFISANPADELVTVPGDPLNSSGISLNNIVSANQTSGSFIDDGFYGMTIQSSPSSCVHQFGLNEHDLEMTMGSVVTTFDCPHTLSRQP
jgi:hypothetical protein